MVYMWEFKGDGELKPTKTEVGKHDDWVRDVAWCSSIGLAYDMIASVSEEKSCKIWKNDSKTKERKWSEKKITFAQNAPLWKASWSQVGNLLAISGGDNQVHVMSEETNGDWKEIQVVNEDSADGVKAGM